jgi:hypothetical protein
MDNKRNTVDERGVRQAVKQEPIYPSQVLGPEPPLRIHQLQISLRSKAAEVVHEAWQFISLALRDQAYAHASCSDERSRQCSLDEGLTRVGEYVAQMALGQNMNHRG